MILHLLILQSLGYWGDVHNQAADQRDQCIADLRPTDPREDKKRIQQTKGWLLKESYDWVFENESFKQWRDDGQNRLLWIKGDPGKGKTMLLLDKSAKTLLSYFFCQGTDSRINKATAVLRGLIYLVIKHKHAGKDLFLGLNAWVALSDIFENILQDPIVKDVINLVDALDECDTDSAKLLDFITQHASLPHYPKKLESHVSNGILSLELKANAESISQAVDTYIGHRVSGLHSIQHNQSLKDKLRDALKQKADGTFLWVSLVMKELEDVQSWDVLEVVQDMPMDLTAVYRRMIEQIRKQRRGNAKFCWKILSTVGMISDLPKEISEHGESISKLVAMCGSFLTIREDTVYFIHQHADIFKQSIAAISKLPQNIYRLPDFGYRPNNAPPPDPDPLASVRYSSLGDTIWSFLKDYVLRWLESVSLLQELGDVSDSIQRILQEVFQFNASPQLSRLLSSIEKFIITNAPMLHRAPLQIYGSALVFSPISSAVKERQWEERLPFVTDIQGVIHTDDALLQTLEGHAGSVTAIRFSLDGEMMASCCAIRQTLEGSDDWMLAVAFVPDCKTLSFASIHGSRRPYHTAQAAQLDEIQLDGAAAYGQSHVLLEGYNLKDVASFSMDGKIIAVASRTDPIELWDAATGACLQTIQSAGQDTTAITFSPDSKTIASGHKDGTVRLWKVATGKYFQEYPLDSLVNAIAFHPDNEKLALVLGHEPGPVLLLDAATGANQKIRVRHLADEAIAFSPDNKKLGLGGYVKRSIRLWNVEIGMQNQRDQGDDLIGEREIGKNGKICRIAFSPDGKILASISELGKNIQLWDAATGKHWQTIECPWIPEIQFSPNGRTLWRCGNGQLRPWDIATGQWQQALTMGNEQHSSGLFAISPDGSKLASEIRGNVILLQEMATGNILQTLERPEESVTAMAFSPDSRILVEAYMSTTFEATIIVWDVATGRCLHILGYDLPMFVPCYSFTFLPSGFLCINHGYIRNCHNPDEELQEHDVLLATDEWITEGGKPLIWLPTEYRSEDVAVHGNVVAIPHKKRR
ncbi:cytochrome cd1-nitrite reductase-like protein [Trichoderma barbatum]